MARLLFLGIAIAVVVYDALKWFGHPARVVLRRSIPCEGSPSFGQGPTIEIYCLAKGGYGIRLFVSLRCGRLDRVSACSGSLTVDKTLTGAMKGILGEQMCHPRGSLGGTAINKVHLRR
jgi:hypothetical protein